MNIALTVHKAWGEPLPDWVEALMQACSTQTQRQVADAIGYSPGAINQVLSKKYKGNLESIETAVRGALLGETVQCPGLRFEIDKAQCIAWQRRARGRLQAISATHTKMHLACRSCSRFKKTEGGA